MNEFLHGDIVDTLEEYGVQGDLDQIARDGKAVYDAQGEQASEDYFMPIMGGEYANMRDVLRLLTSNAREERGFPGTPGDVAQRF